MFSKTHLQDVNLRTARMRIPMKSSTESGLKRAVIPVKSSKHSDDFEQAIIEALRV